MKTGEENVHRVIFEIRNKDMGIRNSIRHYLDPVELSNAIDQLAIQKKSIKLPEAVQKILHG